MMMRMNGASLWTTCRRCTASQRLAAVQRKVHAVSLLTQPLALPILSAFGQVACSSPRRRLTATKSAPDYQEATIRTTESLEDLNVKIKQWLEAPVGTWTARQIAQGHYLLDRCLKDSTDNGMKLATRVLRRWIQEQQAENPVVMRRQLVELLHRVLHGWRLYGDGNSATTAIQLLYEMEQACRDAPDSHRPGNKAYSMVFQLLVLQAKHPETLNTAQELLERRLKSGTADLLLWQSCLNVMAQCSPYHQDAAERAESMLQQMSIPPDQVCFASVLHAWAKSGRPGAAQRAQAILENMLSDKSPVQPNNVCVNTCINAWAKSRDVDGAQRAEDLLRRIEDLSRQRGKEHLQPDSVAYSTVVHAWAKSDDPKAAHYAEQIFEHMQQMNEDGKTIEVDQWTCGSVLDAWSRSTEPGAATRAEAMLMKMEELYEQRKLRVRPSTPMYSTVMNAWAKSGEKDAAQQAERLMKRMEAMSSAGRKNVAPGTIAYTVAVKAWAKSSDKSAPSRALAILRKMQQLQTVADRGVAPVSITYNTVISACANHGEAALASELLEEMHTRSRMGELSVQPDTVTYSSVIYAYAKAGLPEGATQLLDEMETMFESGNDMVRPNTIAYTCAISAWEGYDNSNAGDKAEAILWRMMDRYEAGNSDAKPNAVTVSAVMRVWSAGGEAEAPEKVEALLQWMDTQYKAGNDSIKPSTIHYNHVLETWANSRRSDSVRRIKSMLQKMWNNSREGVCPNCRSYNMLLLAIRNSSDRDRTSQCIEELQEMIELYRNGNKAMKPIRWTFHLVLATCSNITKGREDKERAAIVLRETFHAFTTKDEWLRPNASTYHLLMNACKALGDSLESHLVEEIRRYCEASGGIQWDVQEHVERKQYFWSH